MILEEGSSQTSPAASRVPFSRGMYRIYLDLYYEQRNDPRDP
jgi:hypothetical protein